MTICCTREECCLDPFLKNRYVYRWRIPESCLRDQSLCMANGTVDVAALRCRNRDNQQNRGRQTSCFIIGSEHVCM